MVPPIIGIAILRDFIPDLGDHFENEAPAVPSECPKACVVDHFNAGNSAAIG